LKIELDNQERRAVGRMLLERKALLIEITEDTTQPDSARRSGSIELSVIESIVGKLSPPHQPRGSGWRKESENFPAPHKLADGFRRVFDGVIT
jgi:hypothetical protein